MACGFRETPKLLLEKAWRPNRRIRAGFLKVWKGYLVRLAEATFASCQANWLGLGECANTRPVRLCVRITVP